MGGKFGRVWGREELRIVVWKEDLKERDHLEDLVVNGRIILEMGWEVMDWMDLDQNWERLRALMNGIVTLRFV